MLEFHIHNLKRERMPLGEPRHVYIGRAVPRRGAPASPLANPYPIEMTATREQVIVRYGGWLSGRRRGDALAVGAAGAGFAAVAAAGEPAAGLERP